MNQAQRKTYRLELLREIYHGYFDNKGEPYLVTIKKEEDYERYLALQYLLGKNLVTNSKGDYDNYSLVITYDGMDLVEN